MLSGYAKWRHTKSSHAIRNRFKVALVEKIPLFAGVVEKGGQSDRGVGD